MPAERRQMMRYGISFAIADIFFTHMHADHMLGIIGLFRTLSLQGRTEPMRLWGPRGSAALLRAAIALGTDRQPFPLEMNEVTADTPIPRKGYSIVPYSVDHKDKIAQVDATMSQIRVLKNIIDVIQPIKSEIDHARDTQEKFNDAEDEKQRAQKAPTV